MSQDTENFEQLRRLLALKRHEQPPPGYFNDFSGQVIARIKLGQRGRESATLERLFWEAPWMRRIWAAFETKPILAGVCGVAACGLIITGVLYSDRADNSTLALVPVTESESAPMALANVSVTDLPLQAQPVSFNPASTNLITTTSAQAEESSLLGDIGKLRAQPASFSFPAGN